MPKSNYQVSNFAELQFVTLVVREGLQNLTSPHFVSLSEHSNFENRTKLAESRALERNEPFGEECAGSADWKSGTRIRNDC